MTDSESGYARQRNVVRIVEKELGIPAGSAQDSLFPWSTQSSCIKLDNSETGQSYVLKLFRPSYSHTSAQVVRDEFDCLRKFSQALRDQGCSAVCPEPVALFAEEHAYVMSFFDGRSISTALDGGRLQSTDVISDLIEAMMVFYEKVHPFYGDFHYDNVLVAPDGMICLIDPMAANDYYNQFGAEQYRRGAGDIGYWTYSICAQSVRRIIRSPVEQKFRANFTADLLAEWAHRSDSRNVPAYLAQVRGICDTLLRRLRQKTLFRGKILYAAGKTTQRYLFKAAPRETPNSNRPA